MSHLKKYIEIEPSSKKKIAVQNILRTTVEATKVPKVLFSVGSSIFIV